MKDSKNLDSRPRLVAKSALFFGAGTLSSRIFGLIRDILLVAALPLDAKDAWYAANRLPNFFRRILGEGGLSASFIPLFVASYSKNDQAAVRALINGVFTLLFSISSLICAVALIFMTPLVEWWLGGQGFTAIPGKVEMTIDLARIMFGFLLCMSLFAFFMAVLNGAKKFALTGFAPVLLNVTIIAALLIFKDSPETGTYAAWGLLIGGVAQAGILVPSVIKLGLFPKFSFHEIFSDEVKKVLKRFVPSLFGLGIVQFMGVVNGSFASELAPGAMTYIYMGDRLLELPLSLIAVSIGTALLPTLSSYWSNGQTDMLMASLLRHLQLFLFLAIPAAVGLWLLGDQIISILFVRGQFTAAEVPVVADILKAYCLILICGGSLRIYQQAFYASQDTLTPAIVSAVGLVVHCLMAPYWMAKWGVVGLCLSTALTSYLNMKVCGIILHRRYGFQNVLNFILYFAKCSVAAAVMAAPIIALNSAEVFVGNFVARFTILLVVVFGSSVLYFASAYLLRIEEAQTILYQLKKRF